MNLKKRTWVVPCAVISALAITASLTAAQDTQTAIVSDVNGQRNEPSRACGERSSRRATVKRATRS